MDPILYPGKVYLYKGKPVFMTGGQYFGSWGVSNFWHWRRIKKDGTLSQKEYCDYDNRGLFKKYPGKYTIEVKL